MASEKQTKSLTMKPRRSPEATQADTDDGGVRISVPVKRIWWFKAPADAKKTFELDEVGRFVWDLCDGKTTLKRMIESLAEKYQLNLREAEVSTLKFLEMLSRKRLVGITASKQEAE